MCRFVRVVDSEPRQGWVAIYIQNGTMNFKMGQRFQSDPSRLLNYSRRNRKKKLVFKPDSSRWYRTIVNYLKSYSRFKLKLLIMSWDLGNNEFSYVLRGAQNLCHKFALLFFVSRKKYISWIENWKPISRSDSQLISLIEMIRSIEPLSPLEPLKFGSEAFSLVEPITRHVGGFRLYISASDNQN